jgi:hypothetical protein
MGMNIVKKMGAAGTAVMASAGVLMLGIGPASAVLTLGEVDGVQLFQGGAVAKMVVDVNCHPGRSIVLGVGITQTLRHSPGEAHGDDFRLVTCSVGDNDVRVTLAAAGTPFETGPAVCRVNLLEVKTGQFVPDQFVPCRLSNKGPLS